MTPIALKHECAGETRSCVPTQIAPGGRTAGEHIADMPSWMGGLPEGHPAAPGHA